MATQYSKDKQTELKKEIATLKKELKRLKSALLKARADCKKYKILAKTPSKPKEIAHSKANLLQEQEVDKCPKHHSYPVWIIRLSIVFSILQNMSYRQTRATLAAFISMTGRSEKTPSIAILRQWVQKYSKSVLTSNASEENAKALIIDETMGMGQEKALLILGIDVKNWALSPRNIKHEDAQVIRVKSAISCTGEAIAEELRAVKGTIKYVVSDNGSNLIKACKQSGFIRVPDCTHFMGNYLKSFLAENAEIQELLKEMSRLRLLLAQTENVALAPPNLRSTSKFLNVYKIAEWLQKVSKNWSKLTTAQQEQTFFVQKYKKVVHKIICLVTLVKRLSIYLKELGIEKNSEGEITKIFSDCTAKFAEKERFKEKMQTYVKEVKASLPSEERILCCSDLIESYFGKYKQRNKKTYFQGITQDILCCCAFGKEISLADVKAAMETTSWAQVNEWAKKNLTHSLVQKKRNYWNTIDHQVA